MDGCISTIFYEKKDHFPSFFFLKIKYIYLCSVFSMMCSALKSDYHFFKGNQNEVMIEASVMTET